MQESLRAHTWGNAGQYGTVNLLDIAKIFSRVAAAITFSPTVNDNNNCSTSSSTLDIFWTHVVVMEKSVLT